MKHILATTLALAACHSGAHHTVDAPPPDVPVDLSAATGDPPPNAVKLVIKLRGMPVADVPVYFQAADSSLVLAALTNQAGLAWAEVPAGGFVTAVQRVGSGLDELTTFAAVQPSDALLLDLEPTGDLMTATFTLSLPPATGADLSTAAASYLVSTSCGEVTLDATATAEVTLAGCNGVADMVVVPTDADGVPLGVALYAPDVAIASGAVTALAGTYDSLVTTTFSYTGVPSRIAWLGTYQAVSSTRRAFERTIGEVTSGATHSNVLAMPVAPSATTVLTVTNEFPVSSEVGEQMVFDWHAVSPSYSLDLDTATLPPYATSPIFDPATRTITWTERPGGTAPDLVRSRVHIYRDDIPSGHSWGWRMIAPRGGQAVTYPKLPVVDRDYNPIAGDAVGVDELTTATMPGGYAAFRANGFSNFTSAVSGTSGVMLVQTLHVEVL